MSYFTLAAIELSLLGLLAGVAGTLVVLRRRSFFAVALSHATFPGGVVFALAGWNLLIGQALFAAVLVAIMGLLAKVPGQGSQVSSGVVLAFGFALGTLLTGLNPGLGVPVEALLVGSPLGVAPADVIATGVVLVLSVMVVWLFRRRILFQTFDPAGYTAAGFSTASVELVVTSVIAAAVVVAMPAVGAILGVAILIAPAAAARIIAPTITWVPPIAAALGVATGLLGLWVSREFDLAAGGAVGLVATAVYVAALAGRAMVRSARSARLRTRDGARLGTVEPQTECGGDGQHA
ncbi:metal ABC transporter permease [Leucobacter sp. cx-42]|uniref:metal ABC transporter permease n=1 Tax=unclassified Leucobacter TaxID=2621730 RepID=UPI00165E2D27|nr:MULTISPECIES: metal ABC transporter permease [unclassified Leucobacter]MBC9954182.1 metal ABC transporter permease [Leucobacter sp. cx-42]